MSIKLNFAFPFGYFLLNNVTATCFSAYLRNLDLFMLHVIPTTLIARVTEKLVER